MPPEITKTVSIQTEVKRKGTGFQCDTTHETHLQHWSVTLCTLTYTRLAHNGLQSQTESPHGETYRKRYLHDTKAQIIGYKSTNNKDEEKMKWA